MSNAVEWTAEAKARLKEIPFFVRPAARKKIEKFAQDAGIAQITVEVYEQAKQKFGWFNQTLEDQNLSMTSPFNQRRSLSTR